MAIYFLQMSNTSCSEMLNSLERFYVDNSALNFLWEKLFQSFTEMIRIVYMEVFVSSILYQFC